MRKLTVKNFSVIKDAELEFGKITVLIGPQSSGKSLLCKLAYFLSEEILTVARESLFRSYSWDAFIGVVRTQFLRRFASHSETGEESSVEYRSNEFSARASWKGYPGNDEVSLEFSAQFESLYRALSQTMGGQADSDPASNRFEQEQVDNSLHILLDSSCITNPVYVPAARASFSNPSFYSRHLQNREADPILFEFDKLVNFGSSWNPNAFLSQRANQALESVRREMVRIAGGHVISSAGEVTFRRALDGVVLPIALVSSGTQELLPLLNVLGRVATEQRGRVAFPRSFVPSDEPSTLLESRGLIYLEEPEASVFPSTQYDLIRLFMQMSNEPDLNFSWVVTTHSPYILSSFNNLLEAWEVGHSDDIRNREAGKVIEEKYWVNPDEFRAYAIADGVRKSIVAEDTKLISSNFLDSVSETIGAEFDELLRIGYVDA